MFCIFVWLSMGSPLFGELFPDKPCAGSSTLVSWAGYLAQPLHFSRNTDGFLWLSLAHGTPCCPNQVSHFVKLCTTDAHTRLKSLKWNSLKMASLPSTSFHPTALRFGSSCSLSSVLSLWAFPAWHRRKEREEEQISMAEVGWSGCSKLQGIPWAVELWVHGGSCSLDGRVSVCGPELGCADDGGYQCCPLLPALGTSCMYLGQVKSSLSLLSSDLQHLSLYQCIYVFIVTWGTKKWWLCEVKLPNRLHIFWKKNPWNSVMASRTENCLLLRFVKYLSESGGLYLQVICTGSLL